MDFELALENDETRRTIAAIEDIWRSLDHGDRSDSILEAALDEAVESLRRQTDGIVLYDPRQPVAGLAP